MEGNCDIEKCEWAIIPGYDGVYSISSDGQVRNNVRGRNLRLKNSTKGYKRIDLNKNGKAKSYMVHRLVAASFIPNPNEKEQVNHINGIKWDNRKENLEWATNRENGIHAYKIGLHDTTSISKEILCIQTGNVYRSLRQAAKSLSLHGSRISDVLNGKRPHTKGYTFKFTNQMVPGPILDEL